MAGSTPCRSFCLSPRFVDESHAHPDTVSGANGANQKHPPSYTTPSQPVSVLEVPFFIGHLTLLQESFVSVMDGQNFPSALREHEHVNSTPGADVITPTTMERHEEQFMHVAENMHSVGSQAQSFSPPAPFAIRRHVGQVAAPATRLNPRRSRIPI